jgi:hypothetical protein
LRHGDGFVENFRRVALHGQYVNDAHGRTIVANLEVAVLAGLIGNLPAQRADFE